MSEWLYFIVSCTCIWTSTGLYCYRITREVIRPPVLAWIIRFLPAALTFLGQLAAGATLSLALAFGQMFGALSITCFILYKERKKVKGKRTALLKRLGLADKVAVTGTVTGIVLWLTFQSPYAPVICGITIFSIATVLHCSKIVGGTPESWLFWVLILGAAVSAAMSTNQFSLVLWLGPIGTAVNALAMLLAITYQKSRPRPLLVPA